jgi:hypothetical protein
MGQGGLRPAHLGAGPLLFLAHKALWGRWPSLVDPRNPFGGSDTLPVTPRTFPVAEQGLPIYRSAPLDYSGTPRDIRDLIRDSEQPLVTTYISHYYSSLTEP